MVESHSIQNLVSRNVNIACMEIIIKSAFKKYVLYMYLCMYRCMYLCMYGCMICMSVGMYGCSKTLFHCNVCMYLFISKTKKREKERKKLKKKKRKKGVRI